MAPSLYFVFCAFRTSFGRIGCCGPSQYMNAMKVGHKNSVRRYGNMYGSLRCLSSSSSSSRWLRRQRKDVWARYARKGGFRSRSALKLKQIDEKSSILRRGSCVVDLGASPGGWSQVAAEAVGVIDGGGTVVAVDVTPFEEIPGVIQLQLDVETSPENVSRLIEKHLPELHKVDVGELNI